MIKKNFLLLLLLILTSCSYEAIYSKKNLNEIIIQDFQLNGDKKINRKIVSYLNLKENKDSQYVLILDSNKLIEIVSKSKAGKPSIYKTTVNVNINLMKENKVFKQKNFTESFTYSNMRNKFDLSQNQKSIELNLIDKIIEDLFIFLNN
jgi:hypothetical protein